MVEIYWITRLGTLHNLGVLMTTISLATSLVCLIISITTDDWTGEDCCTDEQKNKLRNIAKRAIIPFFIGILMWTFIPTKKEAFLIYGLGGTIDYIKQNNTAKQLPDKCIDALDRWVDSLNKSEKENK